MEMKFSEIENRSWERGAIRSAGTSERATVLALLDGEWKPVANAFSQGHSVPAISYTDGLDIWRTGRFDRPYGLSQNQAFSQIEEFICSHWPPQE